MSEITYKQPTQQELVDMFSPELEEVLKEKIIELLNRIIFIKNQKKVTKEKMSLPFQRKWLKALEEDYKEEQKKWDEYYFNEVKRIARSTTIEDKEFAKWFYRRWCEINLEVLQKEIKKVRRHIAYLISQQPSYVPPANALTQSDIDRARNVDLLSFFNLKSHLRLVPCPFHNERTGSFKIFPDNHFKCFGCGEHGDVIDYIQKIHQMTFKEAVRFLLTQ